MVHFSPEVEFYRINLVARRKPESKYDESLLLPCLLIVVLAAGLCFLCNTALVRSQASEANCDQQMLVSIIGMLPIANPTFN